MTYLKPVKPTETQQGNYVVRTHPAFGLISAARASGKAQLFGSPIEHNGFVKIEITGAEERLDLHRAWHYPLKDHIEIWVSEAQWAAFVSTMNIGSGVPCTIKASRDGIIATIPGIDDNSWAEKQAADIKAKVMRDMADLKAAVAALDELLTKPTVKKADLAKARAMFTQCVDHAAVNYQFAADSVTEHTEHLVQAAKAEITAFAQRVATQNPQLASSEVKLLEDK